ncbi:MAVS protein, partial [Syrrhaptes paradoxus]|nr:MAVS protein [Syrrhaptes paradoxus]
MGFAEEKVYDYILKNLQNFKNIRVASLADSLSCLTDADRDELYSREEMRGSQATAYRFYQHLKCRQGWVPDLIDALRQNNAGHLADELQHVYDTWQTRMSPRCPPAPTAALSPPAASDARPAVPSIGAQTPSQGPNPAPAEPSRQDMPAGGCPPLPPSAVTTTSTDLDARAPVQESLPKNLQQDSPWPPPPGSTVRDEGSDGHGRKEHLPHPIEAVQVAAGTPGAASVAVPSAVPPEWGWDWLSRSQQPVCVDNGCFGNANHLHRSTPGLGLSRSFPLRDAGAPRSPSQPRNEPQEDVYISTESPPTLEEPARRGGLQPPDSPPKNQAVPGAMRDEPPGSSVDVRSPLLIQQQFDAEQKRVRMLQEHRGDTWMEAATTVDTLVARDASPSCDTSLKPPVQEKKLSVGETASSTPFMLTKERVLPASADPLLDAAQSSEGMFGRSTSRVSSATTIWAPCSNVERDDLESTKPGVLLSVAGESPAAAARCPSSQGPGGTSGSLTFSSDPLMVSTDSSSSGELSRVSAGCPAPAAREDPGGEEAAGASRDSHQPPGWDGPSLGTHEVRVDHYPSTQLGAGSDLRDGTGSFGNPPGFDSSRGQDTATSSSQAEDPPGDSDRLSLPYIFPAVGIALLSAVAFLVYTRLQK